MDKKYFSIYFNGAEIILPKSEVSFKWGYGIVKTLIPVLMNSETTLLEYNAVVDENFNVCQKLISYVKMSKIEIFPNNKFVILYNASKISEESDYVVCVCNLNKDGLNYLYNLPAYDFEVINAKNILLKCSFQKGEVLKAIYDVVNDELLTGYYNYIGTFQYKKEYNSVVANAITTILYDGEEEPVHIGCYIDKEGKVLSSYQSSVDNTTYNGDIELEEVIELVRKKIKK